jgi:hypothetical protein
VGLAIARDLAPPVLETIFVCLGSLVAPGAVGVLGPAGRGPARRFVHALAAAALLNVISALVLKLAGVAPTPASFGGVLGFLTVASGAVAAGRGGSLPTPRQEPLAYGVALGAFALALFAGSRVVPPLEDQDTEVQGTAYGLAHDLEPLCLTNRSTLYFFAHPLLLHALNASTLTLAGDLPTVRPPYEVAKDERSRLPAERRERGLKAILRALRDPGPRSDRSFLWFQKVYRPFRAEPALLPTRAPNFVLAAAAAVLLLGWARRLGAGAVDATLLTASYVTLPEIFVRSGYGGYYALTAATLLAGAWLAAGAAGGGRSGYAAGVLAILANQKALVLAAAVSVYRGSLAILRRSRVSLSAGLPLVFGMVAGGAAFWAYGLGLAPDEFVADHILDHGFRRFAGEETGRYPARAALWLEFARHMGWVWMLVVGIAVGRSVRTVGAGLRDARTAPSSETVSAEALLLLWILVGAVLFTLTDWRQTKHLCLVVPAASVLCAPLLAHANYRLRIALRAGLVFAILWNLTWIVRLARDFRSLTVSPIW